MHLIGGPKGIPKDSTAELQLHKSGRLKSSPENRPLLLAAATSPEFPILMNKALASGDHRTRLRSLLACNETLSGELALPVPGKTSEQERKETENGEGKLTLQDSLGSEPFFTWRMSPRSEI